MKGMTTAAVAVLIASLLATLVAGSASFHSAYLPLLIVSGDPSDRPTPTATTTLTGTAVPSAAPSATTTVTPTSTPLPSTTHAATPTPTASATPTATQPACPPTPIPPFPGSVGIDMTWNAIDGWSLPANVQLKVEATAPDGTKVAEVLLQTDADGHIPWQVMTTPIEENDWITLTIGSLQSGFPVRSTHAIANPSDNTIEGIAMPCVLVGAKIVHPPLFYIGLQTYSGPDGRFRLDLSPVVDWEYGDGVLVEQFVSQNGRVVVTQDTWNVMVIPPAGPTRTPVALQVPTPSYGAYSGLWGPGALDGLIADYSDQTGGKRFAIRLTYSTWRQHLAGPGVQDIVEYGLVPMLSWAPDGIRGLSLDAIIQGRFDDYVRACAQEVAGLNAPVLLRLGWEMNGGWYPWGGPTNGGGTLDGYGDPRKPDGPERFVDAWRRIYSLFGEQGAHNVYWVFSPNASLWIWPNEGWNSIASYYPGDEYVDWVGLDGYNWGRSQPTWGNWVSFKDIFDADLRLLHASIDKPFMIAEFASTEVGGNKAAWITDAYASIKNYPYIKAVVWFNEEGGGMDWRFHSSESSRQAFAAAIADPYYIEHVPGWPAEQ